MLFRSRPYPSNSADLHLALSYPLVYTIHPFRSPEVPIPFCLPFLDFLRPALLLTCPDAHLGHPLRLSFHFHGCWVSLLCVQFFFLFFFPILLGDKTQRRGFFFLITTRRTRNNGSSITPIVINLMFYEVNIINIIFCTDEKRFVIWIRWCAGEPLYVA